MDSATRLFYLEEPESLWASGTGGTEEFLIVFGRLRRGVRLPEENRHYERGAGRNGFKPPFSPFPSAGLL